MGEVEKFIIQLTGLVDESLPMQLILSKPRPNHAFKSQTIVCIDHDTEGMQYKAVEKSTTQHFTKVYTGAELISYLKQAIANQYYYIELISDRISVQLLQNAKGTATLINKKKQAIAKATHNDLKQYQIAENVPFLQLLGISSAQGKVYDKAQKKYRQINKFIEILEKLIPQETVALTIADMGSGKAYLTFASYYYLTVTRNIKVSMVGYELRQDLVDQCNKYSSALSYHDLKFVQANILEVEIEQADMIISLHACDIATDMAIHAALKSKAHTMVLAPCCHKQIRKQITITNSILKHPILLERQAELLTDAMRALILESQGYKTKVFEFISSEHTSKNLMIIAEKDKINPDALSELGRIKEEYGMEYHYLERLLGLS